MREVEDRCVADRGRAGDRDRGKREDAGNSTDLEAPRRESKDD
jgi:hypothetical protein